MTESEYLRVTNRVKVSAALVILRDVLPGEGYGISIQQLSDITVLLGQAEIQLFSSIETIETGEDDLSPLQTSTTTQITRCEAHQCSDQKRCDRCNFTWDMNDCDPPQCLTDEEVNRLNNRKHIEKLKGQLDENC